jgi:hypothetical protein
VFTSSNKATIHFLIGKTRQSVSSPLPSHCILDCIYNKEINTTFILDVLQWKKQDLKETTNEFRFFWLESKCIECEIPILNNQTVESSMMVDVNFSHNTHKFILIPSVSFNCTNLSRLYEERLSSEIQFEGLLFYHAYAHYSVGFNPLAVFWTDNNFSNHQLSNQFDSQGQQIVHLIAHKKNSVRNKDTDSMEDEAVYENINAVEEMSNDIMGIYTADDLFLVDINSLVWNGSDSIKDGDILKCLFDAVNWNESIPTLQNLRIERILSKNETYLIPMTGLTGIVDSWSKILFLSSWYQSQITAEPPKSHVTFDQLLTSCESL